MPTAPPRCPICDAPVDMSGDNPWRPFCSERCKLLDLGRWLGGEYVIPGPPTGAPQDREPDEEA